MVYQVRGLKPGWTITRREARAFGRYYGEPCVYCGRRAAHDALSVPFFEIQGPGGWFAFYRACSVAHLRLGLRQRWAEKSTGEVPEEDWPWRS